MNLFFYVALLLRSSFAFADISYICKVESKTAHEIHLNFSSKSPRTIGFTQLDASGKEVIATRLSCWETSPSLLKCSLSSAGKKSEPSIAGSYSRGETLVLVESGSRYKCAPKTAVQPDAGVQLGQ